MKMFNRVYGDWSKADVMFLKSHGIDVEEGTDRFDIEASLFSDELKVGLSHSISSVAIGTLYSKKEIEKSKLLVLEGSWTYGYPQPEQNFGYLNLTYDTTDYCRNCGVGATQIQPFRIKRTPDWKGKKIFDLNWVFDEVFVKKDVYDQLFKRHNIGCIPVQSIKGNRVFDDVVQLSIEPTSIPLNLSNQSYELCSICNRKKYSPQIAGYFPAFVYESPTLPMFKSMEYFGSDFQASKKIFISQQLRREMLSFGIKAKYSPVAEL